MRTHLLLFLLLLLLGSCSRNLYVPNNLNTPLFESRGENKVSLSTKIIAPFSVDLQTACAPLEHFALMLNANTMNFGDKESSSSFKHYFAEAGTGVFVALWPNKYNHRRLRLEMFGGYGIGASNIKMEPSSIFNLTSSSLQYQGGYHRKFLQPAIGLKGRKLQASFALRLTEVNFSRYKDFTDGLLTAQGFYNFSVLEPVFSWGINHRKGGVYGQIGAILPTKGLESDYRLANASGWTYFHLTMGFTFSNYSSKRRGAKN